MKFLTFLAAFARPGTPTGLALTLVVMCGGAGIPFQPARAEESGGSILPLPTSSGRDSGLGLDEESESGGAPAAEASSVPKMEVYPAFEPEARGDGARSKTEVPHLQDFDPVPEYQREPVIRRLRLIERLIREHGRAYDYRELTTVDLNAIIQSIEQKKAGSSGSHPKK